MATGAWTVPRQHPARRAGSDMSSPRTRTARRAGSTPARRAGSVMAMGAWTAPLGVGRQAGRGHVMAPQARGRSPSADGIGPLNSHGPQARGRSRHDRGDGRPVTHGPAGARPLRIPSRAARGRHGPAGARPLPRRSRAIAGRRHGPAGARPLRRDEHAGCFSSESYRNPHRLARLAPSCSAGCAILRSRWNSVDAKFLRCRSAAAGLSSPSLQPDARAARSGCVRAVSAGDATLAARRRPVRRAARGPACGRNPRVRRPASGSAGAPVASGPHSMGSRPGIGGRRPCRTGAAAEKNKDRPWK